jgi:Protein of unknown function (DUF2971)
VNLLVPHTLHTSAQKAPTQLTSLASPRRRRRKGAGDFGEQRQSVLEDRKLFKYLSLETAKIVLTNRTLRWSTPATLNDPFDIQTPLSLPLQKHEVVEATLLKLVKAIGDNNYSPRNKLGKLIAFVKEHGVAPNPEQIKIELRQGIEESFEAIRQNLPKFNSEMLAKLASSKILCLTEAATNVLMWAHYASDHRGVVLQFGTPAGIDSPWLRAKKIQYVSEPPAMADLEFLSDFLSGQISFDPKKIIEKFVYTKSQKWDYEQEWRIYRSDVFNKASAYEDLHFHPQELFGLVFGCRADQETIRSFSALGLLLNPSLTISQAKNTGFILKIEKLDKDGF